MRRVIRCLIALGLVGCSRPADKPADSTVGEAPEPAAEAPAGILADVAGTWDVRAMTETGNDTVVTFQVVATGDTEGWSFNFPDREPVPARVVAVESDSIVAEAGPYESVLRKGVQVTTRSVFRMAGGRLVGTTEATYAGGGPDSVLRVRFEGTRAP